MLDIRWIRDNPSLLDAALAKRGAEALSETLIGMDETRRSVLTELQEVQEKRNQSSKFIGKAKASGDEEQAKALMDEVSSLKSMMQALEEKERELGDELNGYLSALPNIPYDDVPEGKDEADNVELRVVGAKPSFDFTPKEHFDIGEALEVAGVGSQMDFEASAKLAGSRFVVLRAGLARMERALAQFMLDLHTNEHGYIETSPPLMVRDEIMFGTGQLPKFSEDSFRTTDDRWLIPTAEVPLTNLVRETILPYDSLPLRMTAFTPCFRSEAGSAGRDQRGMLRVHQFPKVELVSITEPDQSEAELERMVGCAEEVLKRLGLHYRVVKLCAGDMGFGARKTYDIEVWLPGQDTYREISSVSVCGDFQARRMNTRYRAEGEKKPQFVHTLNGSALAVGRTLLAVVENYQREDGSVAVPEVLQSYMGGITELV